MTRDITLPPKVCLVKAMVFPVVMYGCESWTHKESWALKNWCFWTVVLEKTLQSPLDYKEIQPVHPKENQSWIFIGRSDAKAEAPILWPPDAKNWLIRKDPWCWERLKAGREGDDRGWDGWAALLTQTWVWVNSRRWWKTGKPGMLQSQSVGHNWATKQHSEYSDFPGGSGSKEPACNAGDLGLNPWSGRSPGEGNGNPLQYSCLENSMDRRAWWAIVHQVAKSWTRKTA